MARRCTNYCDDKRNIKTPFGKYSFHRVLYKSTKIKQEYPTIKDYYP
jgi:hypothetical protein